MSIAGTSLFQVEGGYDGSISLVSCADASHLGTKSFSIPSASMLTEVVESLLSQFHSQTISHSICAHFVADDDRSIISDSLNAISQSIARRNGLPDPGKRSLITHGQAIASGTLPHEDRMFYIMFLDFSPTRMASETLLSIFYEGERKEHRIRETNVGLTGDISVEDAIRRGAIYRSEPPLDRIVLNNPPQSLTQSLLTVLSESYPNIPVTVASASDISQALATYRCRESQLPRKGHRLGPPGSIPFPICIASPTGVAMPLVDRPGRWRFSQEGIFSTSMDNQTTATVRLLLGDHPLAKDNLERTVIFLQGLKPLPKGVLGIKVSVEFSLPKAFMDMVVVTVEEVLVKDGDWTSPSWATSKMFIFPHFFDDVDGYDERYDYDIEGDYDDVQPELPE